MVNGKKHNFTSKLGAFKRLFGRSNLQVGDGQGGLHTGPPFVSPCKGIFQKLYTSENRSLCLTRKQKMDQFVSRWPHWEAVAVDALQCPLDNLGDLYANPPWSVIEKFLPRLKQFPNAKVLMVLPYWDSATWWPQLIKMKIPKTPCLRVTPYRGMFKNCWGEEMPPPRWDLLCIICSGKFWRGDKFKIQPLKISLKNTQV